MWSRVYRTFAPESDFMIPLQRNLHWICNCDVWFGETKSAKSECYGLPSYNPYFVIHSLFISLFLWR